MNSQTVKTPESRFESPDIKNLDIIGWGEDNLYPHRMDKIVANSETGDSCLSRYIKFIKGQGFKDLKFASHVLNKNGDTSDDILQQIARDLGSYEGFALHFNFNVLGEIVEINHIPFEHCRLGTEDENGRISKIAVFPDWTGSTTRGGKRQRPTKENIDYIDTFSPETVIAQIEAVGGIENYKGQILWVSSAGRFEYPKPIYDRVVTYMSTEEGLANISYRNTRNNFNLSGMLVVKRGQDTANAEKEDESQEDELQEDDSIAQSLGQVQGDINTNKIIVVNVEHDEDIPQFVQFQGANYDKDYTVTSDTTCEKIYAAFGQETFYRFRQGSFGLSSDIIKDAYSLYSTETRDQRLLIERVFEKVFKYYTIETFQNFEIERLTYDSASTRY